MRTNALASEEFIPSDVGLLEPKTAYRRLLLGIKEEIDCVLQVYKAGAFLGQWTGKGVTHWARREHLAISGAWHCYPQDSGTYPPHKVNQERQAKHVGWPSAQGSQTSLGHCRKSCPARTKFPLPPGASRGVQRGLHIHSSRLNTVAFAVKAQWSPVECQPLPTDLKYEPSRGLCPHNTVHTQPGGVSGWHRA